MMHDVEGCLIEDCFGCKVASVSFAGPSHVRKAERRFDADNAAYRRLRDDGVQPSSPAGAAKVEATANTRGEVEA